ncbi:MAG: DUF2188 domain-containing protein [Clostridiales bacterium]|nr:DUF2188 domain-containing protein [Clostridiales bacterium]
MDALNNWAYKNLGDWSVQYPALFLLVAVVLLVVIVVLIIIMAVRHVQLKKKITNLESKANVIGEKQDAPNEEEIRKQVRAELEKEYEGKVAERPSGTDDKIIADLHRKVDEKQQLIDDLTKELEKGSNKSDNGSLYRTINELNNRVKAQEAEIERLQAVSDAASGKSDNGSLYRTINELNSKVKEQEAEIARLKGKDEKESAPAQKAEPIIVPTNKPAPAKSTAKAKSAPEPEPEEDDDEEYYDDEYGDETSAIKVTLKFDRNKNNWVILRSDSERAYRRVQTKQEALTIAKDLARRLQARLAVHKKDGKFQKI